ncbi:UPF0262 family protein [Ahrensia sp. R2A130]|uniref:UPF0262 family protein n=1 Tax=Ahrensia sp. R2A130 TaxID=744979 RepID=UPI0001E0A49D|nr:UPF0262 family protein [Ahrensia sp. R2A130]EFL88636.1 conserved hypothetical protein [Ahrensia sp. R2A130]
MSGEAPSDAKLIDVVLDDATIGRANADVEHERAVAIFDLIEQNHFWPVGHDVDGVPHDYKLKLGLIEQRLVFSITDCDDTDIATHILSLSPFRRTVREYYQICESYYEAIRSATPSQIEAIDMARRGLHNDGSETLKERLSGKIEVDHNTARRLFTLICVLHWRG